MVALSVNRASRSEDFLWVPEFTFQGKEQNTKSIRDSYREPLYFVFSAVLGGLKIWIARCSACSAASSMLSGKVGCG